MVGATGLDFASVDAFGAHHFAFAVEDALFDRVLQRRHESGRAYSADPLHARVNGLNDNNDGRGLYFRNLDGHNIELLTVPEYAAGTNLNQKTPWTRTSNLSREYI